MIIEEFLEKMIPYITGPLELIGVIIISIAAIRTTINLFKKGFNFDEDEIGISFIKAMSLSLEFKLAAEIIKTVVIKNLDEFIILAAVGILRIVISIVLNWELKSGVKSVDEKHV